jgi:hypothetical protein
MIHRLPARTRILLTILALAAAGLAQSSNGTITGRILDPSGSLIDGAAARLINQDTRSVRSVASVLSGEFVFNSVEPGVFTLLVTAPGFKQYEQRDLQLSASGRLNAGELKLEIGSATDCIEVKGTPPPVQTTSSERSQTLDAAQLSNLPSRGGDFLGMLVILPGVVNDTEAPIRWASSILPPPCRGSPAVTTP